MSSKSRLSDFPELKENPSNFLEALLVEQEKEGRFSDKEIFGNVFTILMAGEDTTANTISWTLYFLATHPEVFKKLRKEADQVLGDKKLATSYDLMDQMKYAEAVANESVRIRPASPMLIMQAKEDTVVENLEIKKGMSVILQNKVGQTKDEHFAQPDQFLPERWLQPSCPFAGAHSPQLIKSFGGGPRFCPGRNLAIHQVNMAISMICKNFDIELAVKPEEVEEFYAFTMYPKNLLLKLKKRA